MVHKIENISKLFDFANSTIYKWKKEKRLILDLFDKYFTDEDIEEFLKTGKIERLDIAQSNKYLINKSINLYKKINYKLTPKAKSIFFEELENLKSYKIEDVSNIIFYSIKDEDLDSAFNYINGISKISIRLNLLKLFDEIDDFELEYFIKNLKEIKQQSNKSVVSYKNKGELVLGVYGVEENNLSKFEERFFKIEKNHFIKIKTIEKNDNNDTLILFDIVTIAYTKKFSIESFKIIESDKKLILTINEYDVFSTLIVKMTEMKFF